MELGTPVTVSFNVKGFNYTKDNQEKNFTSLEAWRIVAEKKQHISEVMPQEAKPFKVTEQSFNPSPETIDDLPF